jgi:hypothetical protein
MKIDCVTLAALLLFPPIEGNAPDLVSVLAPDLRAKQILRDRSACTVNNGGLPAKLLFI